MKKYVLSTGAFAVALLAAPAFAQDGFGGAYIGGQIGAARVESKAGVVTPTARASRSQDKTALTGGVFAGYGAQFDNNIYLGGEFALGGSGGKTTTTPLAGVATRDKPGLNASLSGRLGYAFAEDTMLYGRLGVETRRDEFLTPAGRTNKTNVSGALFGVGLEHNFGETWSGRVELQRADYGKKTLAGTGTTAAVRTTYEPSETRFLVGAAFRF